MMRAYYTLVRRELGSFFVSFTGYVVIAAAAFLMGLGLVSMVDGLRNQTTSMPVTQLFYGTAYFWLILLPSTPVITMRLFALEKFTGTFETLMTTPVSDRQVVFAKFTAALLFFMMMWLPLIPCLFILRHLAGDPTLLDSGALGGMFIGIALLGCLFVSIGAFASSLTRSQALASMTSLALGVGLFLLSFFGEQESSDTGWRQQVLSQLSMNQHMHDFVQGIVDTRHVVFYLSGTAFFLFLTLRVIESRRWK
jgi:ABC-2 type transport system permease protein